MPWIWIQTAAFAVGLGGLLLAMLGLVGRRTGGGTRCRGCGYDVSGIIDEQDTCPECGRSITGKRSTVSGTRVRRNGLIIVGLLMLAPASAAGWYVSTMVQPVATRPTWLMAGQLWLGPTSDNTELARELQRRWRDGNLDGFGRRALVDWGLSAWTTPHASRDWMHAQVVRAAFFSGDVSAEQFDAFVTQLLRDIGDDTDTSRQRVALSVASELGTAISPRLEIALGEPAFRDAAVMLLLDELSNTPTTALVAAAIESLGHTAGGSETGPALDRLPLSIEAGRAVRYLTFHADICAPSLRAELTADEPQRRLLAALALTEARDPADAAAIGRAVAHAFEPNDTAGDSKLASRAILRAGRPALEAARAAAESDQAKSRIAELAGALGPGPGPVPPHLEALAGPLPWQSRNPGPRLPGFVP